MRLTKFAAWLTVLLVAKHAQPQAQVQTPRVVAYVIASLQQGDLASASALVAQYRRLNGDTPEALEALSWIARAEVASGNREQGVKHAQEILDKSKAALATRKLDSEPHLPIAVGAAYELEAQSFVEEHRRTEALQLLQSALRTWRGTSVVDRLQKNINLLTLEGRPVPVLQETEWIGSQPKSLAALRGKVVLLFFWAHWCADCKADIPIISQIATEYRPRGLVVVAPTRRYGYTAESDNVPPAQEKQYIQQIYSKFYGGIPNAGVPLSQSNFERFGVSTTPTIVLVSRNGLVKLYHPGAMDAASLRSAIEPLLAPAPATQASR